MFHLPLTCCLIFGATHTEAIVTQMPSNGSAQASTEERDEEGDNGGAFFLLRCCVLSLLLSAKGAITLLLPTFRTSTRKIGPKGLNKKNAPPPACDRDGCGGSWRRCWCPRTNSIHGIEATRLHHHHYLPQTSTTQFSTTRWEYRLPTHRLR